MNNASMAGLEQRRREVHKLLEQARMLSGKGPTSERERARLRMRAARAPGYDVLIRPLPPENQERRARLEADTEAWLAWYFPKIFWHPFTEVGKEMIWAIETTILYGTDQCIAGPRGEGKSTIAERVILKNVLTGRLSFGLIFGANSAKAMERLQNIKAELEENDRLAADYPEVCDPIRALEGMHNRANGQTASGEVNGEPFHRVRTKMRWAGELIRLPNVPGSRASGGWIGCYGLDTPVRGANLRGMRPVHALIDDADTEETANNEEQAAKLEARIDRAIAGLAPQGQSIGRVMLCTIPSKKAVAWKFSDPREKPSWHGKRYKLVEKWPDHPERWEEYVQFRREDLEKGDEFARRANTYYLANRVEMDAGVVVTNPYRFNHKLTPDGSPIQVSTIQFCYDEIVRTSQEAFAAEYQSEAIEEQVDQEPIVTSTHIQSRVSGLPKYLVPEGCTVLTQGIDIGKQFIYAVVRAWKPDGTGYTIDYETLPTGVKDGADEGVDEAIERVLYDRRDFIASGPYRGENGNPFDVQLTLIDARWRTDTIYQFCRQAGARWMAAMGCGDSPSCGARRYTPPIRSTTDKRLGNRWFRARQQHGIWLIMLDSNYWIQWEHDHWMRDLSKPGALWLFGVGPNAEETRRGKLSHDQYDHKTYGKHITAERQVPEVKGGNVQFVWHVRGQNHYLDCSKLCDVAADMSGLSLTGAKVTAATVGRTISLREWFGER